MSLLALALWMVRVLALIAQMLCMASMLWVGVTLVRRSRIVLPRITFQTLLDLLLGPIEAFLTQTKKLTVHPRG
jgi:hypothetical protein